MADIPTPEACMAKAREHARMARAHSYSGIGDLHAGLASAYLTGARIAALLSQTDSQAGGTSGEARQMTAKDSGDLAVGALVAWLEDRTGAVLPLVAEDRAVLAVDLGGGGIRICFGVVDELVASEPPAAMVQEEDGGPRYISRSRLWRLPRRFERLVEIELADEAALAVPAKAAPEATPEATP